MDFLSVKSGGSVPLLCETVTNSAANLFTNAPAAANGTTEYAQVSVESGTLKLNTKGDAGPYHSIVAGTLFDLPFNGAALKAMKCDTASVFEATVTYYRTR